MRIGGVDLLVRSEDADEASALLDADQSDTDGSSADQSSENQSGRSEPEPPAE
jgi:hypothetical protein